MSGKPPSYTPRAERFPESYPTTPTKGNPPRSKPRNIDHFLRTPGEGLAPIMSETTTQPVGTETKGKAPEPKTPSRSRSPNEAESGNPGNPEDPGNPGTRGNGPPPPPPSNRGGEEGRPRRRPQLVNNTHEK